MLKNSCKTVASTWGMISPKITIPIVDPTIAREKERKSYNISDYFMHIIFTN
jgi:hypothetical protein